MPGGDHREAEAPLQLSASSSPMAKMPHVEANKGKVWNTKALGMRVGADAVAAASAGVLVAPIITIIDR